MGKKRTKNKLFSCVGIHFDSEVIVNFQWTRIDCRLCSSLCREEAGPYIPSAKLNNFKE